MARTAMSDRPTDADLRRYGYAPGNYISRCEWCKRTPGDMDKRAICCRECAIAAWNRRAGEGGGE